MIIDSHAHYDDEAFIEDRDFILSNLQDNGIELVVNIGASMQMSEDSVALSNCYDHVYAVVGVHPDEVAELDEAKIEVLRNWSTNKKVVAIGEIGLDYSRENCDKELQKEWFCRQLDLARECDLPVVVHSRDASKDTLDILQGSHGVGQRGIIHCYSYSAETAKAYLKMGYYFGIGGVVTFKNAVKLKEAVALIPLDRIVLETDCPYLAPTPHRGKRNDSSYLTLVAEEIAKIKGITVEEVIEQTTKNSKRIYEIAE